MISIYNPKDKKIILLILTITLISTIILIFNIVKILKYPIGRPEDILYTSTIDDNLYYEVHLTDNDFLEEDYLSKNASYITDLIEYIFISFNYKNNITNTNNLNYSYRIEAEITAESIEDMNNTVSFPIWVKKYILMEPTTVRTTKSPLTVNDQLNINLDYYNNLVEDFKETFNIAINSTLEVRMIINLAGNLENNKQFTREDVMSIFIPLGVKVFDITTSTSFDDVEIVYNKVPPATTTSYMMAIIYIAILFLIFGISYYLIKRITEKYYSKYMIEKNNIIKEYEDRIVHVSNFIKYDKWEIVDVPSMKELVDLSNEAFEPILFWERKYNNDIEAWFAILRDKIIYRYIIYKRNYHKNKLDKEEKHMI